MIKKTLNWLFSIGYQLEELDNGSFRARVIYKICSYEITFSKFLDLLCPSFSWPEESVYYKDCEGSKNAVLTAVNRRTKKKREAKVVDKVYPN